MKNLNCFLRLFLFGIIVFCTSNNLFASHAMGGEINWKCVGKDTFDITVVAYRDCNGIWAAPAINYSICGGGVTSISSVKTSTAIDVTPTCKKSCTRCKSSSCSFPYGIERYLMTGRLITTGLKSTCCNIVLACNIGSRNSAITTGVSGNLYIEAKLNRCIKSGDNSPYLTKVPIALLCKDQCITLNYGIKDVDIDSNGFADSLVYYLTDPLSASGTKSTYSSPYTYLKPLKFAAFPNANASWSPPKCEGFHLDSLIGEINFKATKIDQTVMAIKIEEWGKDNLGKPYKKGETMIEAQLIVITCKTNKVPTLSGINGTSTNTADFCVGQNTCITINSYDADLKDTVKVDWNKSISGATFTVPTGKQHPSAVFCWKPGVQHFRSYPYSFVVSGVDDACPVNGRTSRSYQIYVRPTPEVQVIDSVKTCGDVVFYGFPKNATVITKYVWTLEDSGANYTVVGSKINHHYRKAGTYKWRLDAYNSYNCYASDSGTVTISSYVQVSLPKDTGWCAGTAKLTINGSYGGGTPFYKLVWSTGDTGVSSVSINVTKDTTVFLKITDAKCTNSDTMHIRVYKNPTPNIKDVRTCKNSTVTLQDTNIKYKAFYSWVDVSNGKTLGNSNSQSITDSGQYALIVTDALGCIGVDTANVYFNDPGSVIPKKYAACYGDTINMDGGISDSAAKWNWKTIDSISLVVGSKKKIRYATTTINPTQMLLVTLSQTYKGVTCTAQDTMKITVRPLPNVPVIFQSNDTLYATNTSGVAYQWTNDTADILGAANSWYHPTQNGKYRVRVTDSFGCSSICNLYSYAYTGIGNSPNEFALNIYPNPAKDVLNIEVANANVAGFENLRGLQITLFNTLGQKVYEAKLSKSSKTFGKLTTIDLKNIPAGVYMVQVIAGEKIARRTVVVKQ
ncbi:MAG: T9SS type A sorting domain-containing protein [Bacteroidetes bacterium]|nr:T9SS type A sorting domain-containing protein [Bacteroidota bacterium]